MTFKSFGAEYSIAFHNMLNGHETLIFQIGAENCLEWLSLMPEGQGYSDMGLIDYYNNKLPLWVKYMQGTSQIISTV